MKTVIKWIFRSIIILIALIMTLWGVVIGAIATPEIITPKIVDIAQKYTKSEVSIKSVDLSLFTRFPNITLRIDSLRITQTKDSIGDLLFAKQCRIAIDPIALLSKKINIRHASLRSASIYMYVDSLNGPLKTFILPEATQSVDTTSSFDLGDYTLSLRRLKIDSTQLVIDDRTKQFYTRVENFRTDMSMNISSHQSNLDVTTGFSNLIVWHKGDLLVKKTSMSLESDMILDMDSLQLSFERAQLRINDIDLQAGGTLRRDSTSSGVIIDIKSSLNTPSITEFLALIPPTIIDNKDQITTQGSALFDVDIKGVYSDNSLPTVEAKIRIDNAKAKYASRKLALEEVNCDAKMFIDFNSPSKSYADIKSLQVNTSEIVDLTFSGTINNIIENPAVDMTIKSNIDFDRFSEVFPLNEGLIFSGKNNSDIKMQFSVDDIKNSNYANLYIDGESIFHNLDITLNTSKFAQDTSSIAYLHIQADKGHMLFGDNVISQSDSRTLRSKINLLGLNYRSKTGEYITIKDVELSAGANFDRTTSAMNGMGIRGIAKNTVVGVDSLFSSNLESSDITIIVMPKNEKRKAQLKTTIISNQITANEPNYNSEIELSTVNMNISMQKLDEQEQQKLGLKQPWDMKGTVAFSDFEMFTDLFPLDIKIPKTSVSIGNKVINLENAQLTLGSSEIVATGHINNLLRKLLIEPRTALSGDLSIKAPFINFSELIEASNKSVLMMEEIASDSLTTTTAVSSTIMIAADSIKNGSSEEHKEIDPQAANSNMFLVPKRVNFAFDLDVKKSQFEDATIDNLEGRAVLKKGVLSLEKLNLKAIGAQATGAIIYRNIDRLNSNIAADINLVGVDINRIGEIMPTLHTMLPMLKSFEGIVDFDLKANTNINGDSELDVPTLHSAMRFKGRNLVLIDSETFSSVSKTLMFKNKERNLIDSLEVYSLVDGSKVDVLPFSMTMDRYSAIIGGSQVIDPATFDVDYKYNISIMKSPLPFKAGVDISGNLEDFKFKVTSAKLKKTDFDEQRGIYNEYCSSIDQLAATLQQEIKTKRLEMHKRRKAQRLAQEQEEQKIVSEEESSTPHQ